LDLQAGWTVTARETGGVLGTIHRRIGERKVRAPQDAVVGNAHRPIPEVKLLEKDRESATERIPPSQESGIMSHCSILLRR